MLCAATVRIGGDPAGVLGGLDRETGGCATAPRSRPGSSRSRDGAPAVRGRGIDVDLALQPAGEPIEVTSPHGDSYIWTRKEPGARASGT